MLLAWRSRLPRARSYRIVVRESACEAASWTSPQRHPGVEPGFHRVPKHMRRDNRPTASGVVNQRQRWTKRAANVYAPLRTCL